MHVDLLFDPFGARWDDVRAGAVAAEGAGFDGVWLYDHLAGSVHGESRVLECWTTLMAATLQEVSGGRLLLGLGAGGGRELPYAHEQYALGREVPGDRGRRANVEAAVATLRQVWSGTANGVSGFLRPDPPPPIIIGGFGAKMAALAGRLADGINVPGGTQLSALVRIARDTDASAASQAASSSPRRATAALGIGHSSRT